MSGFAFLSWVPNTSLIHDIHVTSTHAKASPSATGQSYLSLGDKIEKLGGAWPDVFSLLSPPSLKTSTFPGQLVYTCLFCSWGREPGVLIHRQRVCRGITAALLLAIRFHRVPFWERRVGLIMW